MWYIRAYENDIYFHLDDFRAINSLLSSDLTVL